MKKILISAFAIFTISMTFNALAAVVTLKQSPVVLQKNGDVYVVPEGATYDYYTYGDQVCTATPGPELVGVTATNVTVRVGTGTSTISCYPRSNFLYP